MSNTSSILFVTQISLFPTYGGEKIRSLGLINLFSDMGMSVNAIIGNSLSEYPTNLSPNIIFHEFDFLRKKNYFSKASDYFIIDKKLKELIVSIIQVKKISLVFLDYGFLGQYILFFKSLGIPVLYGTHNSQANLIKQVDGHTFRGKFNFTLASFHEKFYFNKSDYIISVSQIDLNYHSKISVASKNILLPNFVSEKEYFPSESKSNYVIFSANFNTIQSLNGLIWFLNEVWDEELSLITELYLAGNYSKEALDIPQLKDVYLKNVKALGSVSDMKSIIAKAKVSVVPLIEGSGTRLKCVEAMALKTQIVSTDVGAEGIEHKGSILIANTSSLFKKSIIDVLNNNFDMTDIAHKIFFDKYSSRSNLNILSDVVQNKLKIKIC